MMMWHTFGQPLGIMAVTVSFAGGGVLQRFPDLRVGLLEGNCGWAPWLLQRLDEHWEWLGRPRGARPRSRRRRSTSAPNCYLSVESDETTAKYFIDWFGDDNLVFSTDYPHGDSKYPLAVANFLKLPDQRRIEEEDPVGQLGAPLRAHSPAVWRSTLLTSRSASAASARAKKAAANTRRRGVALSGNITT